MKVLWTTDGLRETIAEGNGLRLFQWSDLDQMVLLSLVSHPLAVTGRVDAELDGWRLMTADPDMMKAQASVLQSARQIDTVCPNVETRVYAGPPLAQVLKAAEEMRADMIVMDGGIKRSLRDYLRARVRWQLLNRAPCSVLVHWDRLTDLREVALAYDGSPSSRIALEWLTHLPLPGRVHVTVIAVAEPIPAPAEGPRLLMPYEYPSPAITIEALARNRMKSVVTEVVDELEELGFQVTPEIHYGHPAREILKAVEGCPNRLLVMGAHTSGSWKHDRLENTARSVLRQLNQPALIARPRPDPEPKIEPETHHEPVRVWEPFSRPHARAVHG